MNAPRFDYLTRALGDASSRRGHLAGLVAGALGLAAARIPASVHAKKKRKNTKAKKLKRNAFGCVDVGGQCRGNSANCCSGICEGEKPKKGKKDSSTCLAHNAGSCQAGQDSCSGVRISCGVDAVCLQTTGKSSFCGAGSACTECTRDADCEETFGAGAACVVCARDCAATGGTLCVQAAA
jgi:hypothetical protein